MNKPNIPWWRTRFGENEIQSISQAIRNENISQGSIVAEFERQLASYLGVPYAIATTSGSMALLMSLWVIGIEPEDEVIVPNRTWIATAHAPFLLGAKVILVDVELDRPIIDVDQIERHITEKTRAIIPVHMCGRSANMRVINKIAKRYDLMVIEDAAQALGSRNTDGFLGTQSDMGCYSFSVAKIISTGQGGLIATRDEGIYHKLIAMRTHGVGDVINADWGQPGFNFRFTDILAAIGIEQLKRLPSRIEQTRKIYILYHEGLADLSFIKLIPVDIESEEVPVYIEALCESREALIAFLSNSGVQCRPFYPNLNYAHYFDNSNAYPNSEAFGCQGIYLPSGPEQSLSNIKKVISKIHEFK